MGIYDVIGCLAEVPKEFEIRELEAVMKERGHKCDIRSLSRLMSRIPNHVRLVSEKKGVLLDGKRQRVIIYRKTAGAW